jgi:hypothetical protein
MTRPIASDTAEEIYAGLTPWIEADESTNWQLLRFVTVLAEHLGLINSLVRDTDEGPGWSVVMDADRAPSEYFSWLAQFIGVTPNLNLSPEDQRQQLKESSGFRRGTPASMIAAAQPFLSGAKTVTISERDTSAYHLTVRTFTSETTDSSAVLEALLSQKPAGLVLNYVIQDGLTYDEISASGKTYDQLTAEFPTSNDMKSAQSI